ncbi:MAG: guanylate kinase [Bacteroidales bacterium]
MKTQSKLIIVSAPSGAGKTTIVKHLLASGLNLGFSVSACSRPIRKGETDGKDYFFLTIEEFKKRIEKGDLLEWQEVYPGSFYGSLRSEVDRLLQAGQSVIFDVDVVGGLNIKKIYGERALAIFVMPPSVDILKERLISRSTDSEQSLEKRLDKVALELTFAPQFDFTLINDNLGIALNKAVEVVSAFLKA